jgi:hypothetical protein
MYDGSGKECFVVERCLFSRKGKRYDMSLRISE